MVHERPAVTVIIPSYNYANFLTESVESVLGQTFSDFELIIVDDGSTDDTAEIVKKYLCDPRIHYIYQENRGLSAARNAGIMRARGYYIALLDADDAWLPWKLERQVNVMEEQGPEVALVYCFFEFVDEKSEVLEVVDRPILKDPSFNDLMHTNWVLGSGSSVLIRKSVFDRVGYFDEEMKSLEDLNMWLRILHEFDSARVNEVLVRIRRHRRSMQTDIKTMERNMMLHVEKAVEMFPELRPSGRHAKFEVYKGLLYLSYFNRRKKDMLLYYVKATALRPFFFFEAVIVFVRKYFFRKHRYF